MARPALLPSPNCRSRHEPPHTKHTTPVRSNLHKHKPHDPARHNPKTSAPTTPPLTAAPAPDSDPGPATTPIPTRRTSGWSQCSRRKQFQRLVAVPRSEQQLLPPEATSSPWKQTDNRISTCRPQVRPAKHGDSCTGPCPDSSAGQPKGGHNKETSSLDSPP